MVELLPEPFEFLELKDGVSLTMAVTKQEWGEAVIRPRYPGAPEEKRIPVLRLTVKPGYKPTGVSYWDITSKTLQAQLRPLLPDLISRGAEFTITAHGEGPQKRFSLRV